MLTRVEYLKLPLKKRFIKLSKTEEERAGSLHEKLISVDLHTHITSYNLERGWQRKRVRNSGVTCFFEAIDPAFGKNPAHNFEVTMRQVGSMFGSRSIDRSIDGCCPQR